MAFSQQLPTKFKNNDAFFTISPKLFYLVMINRISVWDVFMFILLARVCRVQVLGMGILEAHLHCFGPFKSRHSLVQVVDNLKNASLGFFPAGCTLDFTQIEGWWRNRGWLSPGCDLVTLEVISGLSTPSLSNMILTDMLQLLNPFLPWMNYLSGPPWIRRRAPPDIAA